MPSLQRRIRSRGSNMAKPKNIKTIDAIVAHSNANKSDPFAAKRMAMTLKRDGHKETKEVHAESTRILAGQAAQIRRCGPAYRKWARPAAAEVNARRFNRLMPRGYAAAISYDRLESYNGMGYSGVQS